MNTDLRNDDAFVDRLTAYLDQRAGRAANPGRAADPGPADVAHVADRTGPADVADDPGLAYVADDVAGAEVAGLAALAGELSAPATWTAPPPFLRDAILSRVRDQAAADMPAEPVAAAAVPETPPPPPLRPARARRSSWRSQWGRLTWAIPVTALAAAAFAVGIIAVDRALQPGLPAGETFVATGTQLAPGATATVVVSPNPSGFSLRVLATGLPAAAPGSYYSAWLHGPRGVVPLGSFHQHQSGSSVALWSGVDPKDYTTLVITLQAEGEPTRPSDLVVMTAALKH